jgi:putative oxidoreductase
MNNFNSTGYNKTLLDWALLALRIFVGIGMLTRFSKINDVTFWQNRIYEFLWNRSKNLSYISSFGRSSLFTFVLMGLFTRFTVIPLIVTMLVAVFIVHGNDAFAKQEMALLYLFHYILIFVAGPGSISIDRMINRK